MDSQLLPLANTYLKSHEKGECPQLTMSEVESCTDLKKLLGMLRIVPNYLMIRRTIYLQIEKTLAPILPDIHDYNELAGMLANMVGNSKAYDIVSRRMCELVRYVDLDKPPKWFIDLLSGKLICPSGVSAELYTLCSAICENTK